MAKLPSRHFQNGTEVQWKMESNTLADCCWSLIRETPTGEYKRQKKTKCVFYDEFCVVRIPYIEAVFII
jgi:hypothetical protein